MNELLIAIGVGVVIGTLLCIAKRSSKCRAYTKRQSFCQSFINALIQNTNTDTETIKLFKKCTRPENSELYNKIVFEVVMEMNNLSKEDCEKRVLEKEIAYLSHQTAVRDMVFNAYRNVWETKHNCKYVRVAERLMK